MCRDCSELEEPLREDLQPAQLNLDGGTPYNAEK
jgi:hypothetical protein